MDIAEVREVSDALNQIPHLNLTPYLPEVPLRDLLKDLFQFDDTEFMPYITGNKNKDLQKHMASNWQALCINDTCTTGRHNIDYMTTGNNYEKLEFRFDGEGKPVYAPTDVGELVPSMIDYIYTISSKPGKTRISRIMPNGGNATWHSHRLLANDGDKRFTSTEQYITPVVHIPLITNKDCWMGVSETSPPRDPKAVKHWRHYHPGEVWVFNSYYFHNAFNNGKTYRDHIMMYMPLDDEKMFPIFKKAVQEYKGVKLTAELIKPYDD